MKRLFALSVILSMLFFGGFALADGVPSITVGDSSPVITYPPTDNYTFLANITDVNGTDDLATILFDFNGTNHTHAYSSQQDGLIGYWRFEDVNGTNHTLDYSGEDNDGKLEGFNSTSTGRFGNGLEFDGTNDYVEVSHSSSLNITEDVSVSTWVYIKERESWQGLVNKGWDDAYDLRIRNTNQFEWRVKNSTGSYCEEDFGNTIQHLNEWTHVVGTYSNTADEMKFYINGDLIDTRTCEVGEIGTNENSLYIGRYATLYLNGTQDEVQIYNRSLSEDEVSKLYSENSYRYIDNTTLEFSYQEDSLVSEKSINWNWYADDTSGNSGTEAGVLVVNNYPQYSNIELPTSPVTYTYNTEYEFNATWTDADLEDVMLHSDFSGSFVETIVTDSNGDEYYYTTTLDADNYTFWWCANDTYGDENCTANYTLEVEKATPLFTSSVSSDLRLNDNSDYQASESNGGDTGCTYTLERDGTEIDTGSSVSDNSELTKTEYTYVYSTDGCDNYLSGSDTTVLSVNDITGNQYNLLWLLPLFLVIILLVDLINQVRKNETLTARMLIKFTIFIAFVVAFVGIITGML